MNLEMQTEIRILCGENRFQDSNQFTDMQRLGMIQILNKERKR